MAGNAEINALFSGISVELKIIEKGLEVWVAVEMRNTTS